jgi:general secretion pathway protein I
LIEVLVALVVVSIALGVLINIGGEQARQQGQARDAQLAQWVAANRLADFRLESPALEPLRDERIERMAERSWRVELQVQAAGAPGVWQVSVSVAPADQGGQLARLVTYMRGS